jgi:hypothetical protein
MWFLARFIVSLPVKEVLMPLLQALLEEQEVEEEAHLYG